MPQSAMSRRALIAGFGAAATASVLLARAAHSGQTRAFPVSHSEAEWRERLTPAQFSVLRRHATERPWSSPLNAEKRRGTFHCAADGNALFASSAKFESGTGWPSFFRVLPGAVGTSADRKLGYLRTEVHCSRCGGHLGHVFDDGPAPTGKRYCMNGTALTFRPA
jgi:peptide-methionine (R)-S-oxide reductase